MDKAPCHLTSVPLKLGGKIPFIVIANADLRAATKNIAFGKVKNNGQICVAPDYALVDETAAEDFCREFRRSVGN